MRTALFLLLVSAVVLCGAMKGIDQPRCKSVRPCLLQLIELNGIAYGKFESLTNKTHFNNICEQIDHCSDQSIQKIKLCSEREEVYTLATFNYMRSVRSYLCSSDGKKKVGRLSKSTCSRKTETREDAESVAWECIMKDIDDYEEGRLNPANCRYLKEQKCWIYGYQKVCGFAYSELMSKMRDIITKYHPHCERFLKM